MLNVLKKSNSRRILQDGYSFLLVSHTSELQNEELAHLDGFIIDTDTVTNANDIVYSIRTHKNIQVSLQRTRAFKFNKERIISRVRVSLQTIL